MFLVAQDMENISEDDGWEFVNLGDQQSFGIKTAGLEEKSTACQMLVSICCNTASTKVSVAVGLFPILSHVFHRMDQYKR